MKTKKIIKKLICIGLTCLFVLSGLAGCGGNKGGGTFIVELYPEYAPETVENFVKLAEEGFFDGLTFHRIVDGFMAQGGWLDADGAAKEAQSIYGEFASNGFAQNTLKHTKGVISMARANDPNSANSQFFIMFGNAAFLDGDYAAFGKVTEGMDIIEKMQEVERKINSMGEKATPVKPVVIKKVTVLEKGDHPKIKFEIDEFEIKK